jgi:hypothetical protein
LTLRSRTRKASQENCGSRVGVDVAAARAAPPAAPQRLHVPEQQRVVEVGRVAPHLGHDLLAQAALGADAEVLGGASPSAGRRTAARRRPPAAARHGAGGPARQQPVRASVGDGHRHDEVGAWLQARRIAAIMHRERFPTVFLAMTSPLTHFDAQGQAHMVDVSAKAETHRVARATGRIRMQPATSRSSLRARRRRAT